MLRQDKSVLTNQPCWAVDGDCEWTTDQWIPILHVYTADLQAQATGFVFKPI